MDALEASRPLAPSHCVRHTRGNGPRALGVRGLYTWKYVSSRREVCRGDSRLSAIARVRSEAAPCRRATGRSGTATIRREPVAARQRSVLSRTFEPHRAYELMGASLAWGTVRAYATPRALRRREGAAGARLTAGAMPWATLQVDGHSRSVTMAKRSRQTFQKHQKEQARQQKQKTKAARRLQAKQLRAQAVPGMGEAPGEMTDSRPGSHPAPEDA
jgi:hypothetical protein